MPFLPPEHKEPNTSNYFKFVEGKNKFRIMSDAIVGYEYWNTANKPVRSKTQFKNLPADIKITEKNQNNPIVYFWAFIVWNYEAEKLQILEITQKTIREGIQAVMASDTDFEVPTAYDLTVTKKKEGDKVSYLVTPSPVREAPVKAQEAFATHKIKLEALYDGVDPFNSSVKPKVEYPKDDIAPEDIPF